MKKKKECLLQPPAAVFDRPNIALLYTVEYRFKECLFKVNLRLNEAKSTYEINYGIKKS